MTFTIEASPLRARIRYGKSRTVSATRPLRLDASRSFDPDSAATALNFSWTCASSSGGGCGPDPIAAAAAAANGTTAPAVVTLSDTAVVPGFYLPVDTYTFTLTITAPDGRTASRTVTRTVVPGSAPEVEIKQIVPVLGETSLPDASAYVAVDTSVTSDYAAALLSYEWSLSTTDGSPALADVTKHTDKRFLFLNRAGAAVWGVGDTVTITVVVTAPDGATGTASLELSVNTPPFGCQVTVSPSVGVFMNDTYTMSVSGCDDLEQETFKYTAYYIPPAGGFRLLSSPQGEGAFDIASLPIGANGYVGVVVDDGEGGKARFTTNVTVNPAPVVDVEAAAAWVADQAKQALESGDGQALAQVFVSLSDSVGNTTAADNMTTSLLGNVQDALGSLTMDKETAADLVSNLEASSKEVVAGANKVLAAMVSLLTNSTDNVEPAAIADMLKPFAKMLASLLSLDGGGSSQQRRRRLADAVATAATADASTAYDTVSPLAGVMESTSRLTLTIDGDTFNDPSTPTAATTTRVHISRSAFNNTLAYVATSLASLASFGVTSPAGAFDVATVSFPMATVTAAVAGAGDATLVDVGMNTVSGALFAVSALSSAAVRPYLANADGTQLHDYASTGNATVTFHLPNVSTACDAATCKPTCVQWDSATATLVELATVADLATGVVQCSAPSSGVIIVAYSTITSGGSGSGSGSGSSGGNNGGTGVTTGDDGGDGTVGIVLGVLGGVIVVAIGVVVILKKQNKSHATVGVAETAVHTPMGGAANDNGAGAGAGASSGIGAVAMDVAPLPDGAGMGGGAAANATYMAADGGAGGVSLAPVGSKRVLLPPVGAGANAVAPAPQPVAMGGGAALLQPAMAMAPQTQQVPAAAPQVVAAGDASVAVAAAGELPPAQGEASKPAAEGAAALDEPVDALSAV